MSTSTCAFEVRVVREPREEDVVWPRGFVPIKLMICDFSMALYPLDRNQWFLTRPTTERLIPIVIHVESIRARRRDAVADALYPHLCDFEVPSDWRWAILDEVASSLYLIDLTELARVPLVKVGVLVGTKQVGHEPQAATGWLPEPFLTMGELLVFKHLRGLREECPICLEEYPVGSTVSRMVCMHYFHADCLSQWLRYSISCPLCRLLM